MSELQTIIDAATRMDAKLGLAQDGKQKAEAENVSLKSYISERDAKIAALEKLVSDLTATPKPDPDPIPDPIPPSTVKRAVGFNLPRPQEMPWSVTASGIDPWLLSLYGHPKARGPLRFLNCAGWGNKTATREWSDLPAVNDPASGKITIDTQIDMCNKAGREFWPCIPHLASDDFARKLAARVRDRLDPKLRVWPEFSNETWNAGMGDTDGVYEEWSQYEWIMQESKRRGVDPDIIHAEKQVCIWNIFDEVLGASRVVHLMGSFKANSSVTRDRLMAADAWKRCDLVVVAPYIDPGTTKLDTLCNLDPSASVPRSDGKGTYQPLRSGVNKESLFNLLRSEIRGDVANTAKNHLAAIAGVLSAKNSARKIGLGTYEFNHHLVGRMGRYELRELIQQAVADPEMGVILAEAMDAWYANGGIDPWMFYGAPGENKGDYSWSVVATTRGGSKPPEAQWTGIKPTLARC